MSDRPNLNLRSDNGLASDSIDDRADNCPWNVSVEHSDRSCWQRVRNSHRLCHRHRLRHRHRLCHRHRRPRADHASAKEWLRPTRSSPSCAATPTTYSTTELRLDPSESITGCACLRQRTVAVRMRGVDHHHTVIAGSASRRWGADRRGAERSLEREELQACSLSLTAMEGRQCIPSHSKCTWGNTRRGSKLPT